jgi:hypothetical protein
MDAARRFARRLLVIVSSALLLGLIGTVPQAGAVRPPTPHEGAAMAVTAAPPEQHQLRFRNTYQGTVYVAVRFVPHGPACGGFEAIQGWWAIPANGKAVTVVSTPYRWAEFYARTASGDVTWGGNQERGVYLGQQFFVCQDNAQGTTPVMFRTVNLGPSGPHTVALGPPR